MSDQLIGIIWNMIVVSVSGLFTIIIMTHLWNSSAAPEPGDPFYELMASTVEGAMMAFGLLGLVSLIAILAWTWSEVQSF
ncbi:hypothetical protein [Natronolimnobius baerhuensis]|uniref:hypothetical protein n=1 Tax=Natronolimnobius baerhuensis TaxID=253108 RepID=UPI001124F8D3|nr:hypothetical protein [Natronolimnobius baerhuensis]